MMSIIVTFLLIIILLSRITEETLKVPTTLTIIIYAFLLSYIFPDLFIITDSEFDEILYLMLPVILLPDILNLSIENLKKSYKEIFYLAFVAVVISIIIATLITPYILQEYSFGFGMLVALFFDAYGNGRDYSYLYHGKVQTSRTAKNLCRV
jgi:CPA1 family monovalent cation:H+ antiporter